MREYWVKAAAILGAAILIAMASSIYFSPFQQYARAATKVRLAFTEVQEERNAAEARCLAPASGGSG